MAVVVTGEPPLEVAVNGGGPWLQQPRETTVAGQPTQVLLLDYGVTVPPPDTPVGTLLFQKGP